MADEIALRVQEMTKKFNLRARLRLVESYVILVIMLALLGIAVFVFLTAKDITLRETGGNLQTKLTNATTTYNDDIKQQDKVTADAWIAVEHAVQSIGEEDNTQEKGKSFNVRLLDDAHRLRSKSDIYGEVQQRIDALHLSLPAHVELILASDTHGLLPPHFRILDAKALEAFVSKAEWPRPDLTSLLQKIDTLYHGVNIDAAAVSKLQNDIRTSEIYTRAGQTPPLEDTGSLSAKYLIQLNITRFGTITLVAIALGIFAPLYRYSARLSAFYSARADALQLYQGTSFVQVGFTRLSSGLTPNFDFAKSQGVPDHFMEMLRLVPSCIS